MPAMPPTLLPPRTVSSLSAAMTSPCALPFAARSVPSAVFTPITPPTPLPVPVTRRAPAFAPESTISPPFSPAMPPTRPVPLTFALPVQFCTRPPLRLKPTMPPTAVRPVTVQFFPAVQFSIVPAVLPPTFRPAMPPI